MKFEDLQDLLDQGFLSREEFENGSHENEPQKMQNKKEGCVTDVFIIIVIIISLALIIKHMYKITENVDIYFDPFEFTVEEKGISRPLTEKEIIEKLGEPTTSKEWKYPKSSNKYFLFKTLTYKKNNTSFREFIINIAPDGSRNVVRISLYEEIAYKNKNTLLSMFNLREYKNSKIEDKKHSYRAKNVGIYDFWIPSLKDNKFDVVKFTFAVGLPDYNENPNDLEVFKPAQEKVGKSSVTSKNKK